jgi:hypothetical protein
VITWRDIHPLTQAALVGLSAVYAALASWVAFPGEDPAADTLWPKLLILLSFWVCAGLLATVTGWRPSLGGRLRRLTGC